MNLTGTLFIKYKKSQKIISYFHQIKYSQNANNLLTFIIEYLL